MGFDPYKPGALDPDHHERLVADLADYAHDAGINSHWICTPLSDGVSEAEIEYLRQFKRLPTSDVCGLAYIGDGWSDRVSNRMSLVTGCLVRNFVRARLMTLGTLLDHVHANDLPELRAIAVPNFFVRQNGLGSVASWHVTGLLDLLMQRRVTGAQSILYVQDMKALKAEYGAAFSELIQNHYVQVPS